MRATSPKPGLVARIAAACVGHRRRVLIAWVLLLVAMVGVSSGLGTRQADNFSLGGTESQRAQDLLERDFPGRSGDVDQIVFHAQRGSITDRAMRDRIATVVARTARLPHVTGVVSPFAAGSGAISRDGRIAFATVSFDKQAGEFPKSAAQRVVSVAREARSPDLRLSSEAPRSSRPGQNRWGPQARSGWPPRSWCC